MDIKTRNNLRELSRLSYEVMTNLSTSINMLARTSLDSPEFQSALNRSIQVNKQADMLIQKQKETIRGLKGNG